MLQINKSLGLVAAVLALFLGFTPNAKANLVTDGVFADTGNFDTNWNPVGGAIGTANYNSMTAVELGTVGGLGSISQLLSTTPGTTYTISFDMAHPDSSSTAELQTVFGGNILSDLLPVAESAAYNLYSFTGLSSGLSTLLQFNERDDPAYIFVTNVSVTPVSTVPLPASLQMFVLGLLMVAGFTHYKRKNTLLNSVA